MAHKNIHRELFKCRIDVKVTAQNSPLASHAALLLLLPLPHTHPQPNTSSLCFCCVTQAAVTVWHVWMRLYQSQCSKVTVSSIKSVFLLFQRQRVRRGALDRIYIFTLKLSCPPDFSCYFSLEPGSRSHSLRVLEILVINWIQQDEWICQEVQIQHLSASVGPGGLWLRSNPHVLYT